MSVSGEYFFDIYASCTFFFYKVTPWQQLFYVCGIIFTVRYIQQQGVEIMIDVQVVGIHMKKAIWYVWPGCASSFLSDGLNYFILVQQYSGNFYSFILTFLNSCPFLIWYPDVWILLEEILICDDPNILFSGYEYPKVEAYRIQRRNQRILW